MQSINMGVTRKYLEKRLKYLERDLQFLDSQGVSESWAFNIESEILRVETLLRKKRYKKYK